MEDLTPINLAPLFPDPEAAGRPRSEYEEFTRIRQRILDTIRESSEQKQKVLEDIAESLLAHDQHIPTGAISGLLAAFGLGKRVYERTRKRKLYKQVVNSILEQLFDPVLEFQMTKKDILDAFDANGMEREKVAPQQVTQIYVTVIHKLRVGELRDLTWEEQLNRYVSMKLREIYRSRIDWELNGR